VSDPHPKVRLCLLGATGFVGRALTVLVGNRPGEIEATALVRGDPSRLGCAGARPVAGDLRAPLSPALFFDAPYVVVHLATKQREDDGAGFDVNVANADRLLTSLTPHCRGIIYGSSASVYGQGAHHGIDETAPERPRTPLAQSRLATERTLRQGARKRGVALVVLRPRFVVGREDRHFLPAVIRLLERGIGVGDCRQALTVIGVDDYAETIVRLATRLLGDGENVPDRLNVGYGEPLRFDVLAALVGARLRRRIPVWAPALAFLRRWAGGRVATLATQLELLGLNQHLDVSALRRVVGDDIVDRSSSAVIAGVLASR
jgi:nucleoside-diphosphate-sugar epimerase